MCKEAKRRKEIKKLGKVARKSKGKSTDKVGITVTNVDVLKIDFKDMAILTIAMIPFFIALNCISSIKTFDLKVLQNMTYAFTLSPILSSMILTPIVYLAIFYLKNKNILNKKVFYRVLLAIGSLAMILSAIKGYAKELILFNVPSYLFIVIVALVILVYYIIKITKVMSRIKI